MTPQPRITELGVLQAGRTLGKLRVKVTYEISSCDVAYLRLYPRHRSGDVTLDKTPHSGCRSKSNFPRDFNPILSSAASHRPKSTRRRSTRRHHATSRGICLAGIYRLELARR